MRGLDAIDQLKEFRDASDEQHFPGCLDDARRIIAAAEAKAMQIKSPSNVAVVDAGGNLLSFARMDGAWLGSIDIAIDKAFTSRAFDITTKDLAEPSQPGGQFFGLQAPMAAG